MKEVSLCRAAAMHFFYWGNGYDVWYFFSDSRLPHPNEMTSHPVKQVLSRARGKKNAFAFSRQLR